MNVDVRAALTQAETALQHASQECKYHGHNFGKLGWTGAENTSAPACESCRQPWRVTRALAAINRTKSIPVISAVWDRAEPRETPPL
jgi:hypothetical protein